MGSQPGPLALWSISEPEALSTQRIFHAKLAWSNLLDGVIPCHPRHQLSRSPKQAEQHRVQPLRGQKRATKLRMKSMGSERSHSNSFLP